MHHVSLTCGADSAAGDSPSRRRGALAAAGFIWQRTRDLGGRGPAGMRQPLTWDEIVHAKVLLCLLYFYVCVLPRGAGLGRWPGTRLCRHRWGTRSSVTA
jgi:hypothetical protein